MPTPVEREIERLNSNPATSANVVWRGVVKVQKPLYTNDPAGAFWLVYDESRELNKTIPYRQNVMPELHEAMRDRLKGFFIGTIRLHEDVGHLDINTNFHVDDQGW